MAQVKRIGPGSAFKIALVVYGLLGLIIGAMFSLIALMGAGMAGNSNAGLFGMFFSVGAIIFIPICYGVIGGIFAAIGAGIYNLAAGWIGGLEVDIS